MNKFLLLFVVFISFASASIAQANFKLKETGYIGALNEKEADDWTRNWSNFNPQNTAYAAVTDTTTLNGTISTLAKPGILPVTGTLTLDATKVYLLKGLVVVRSGGRLVIPAGTLIRAEANKDATPANFGSIIVERGGKIEANGTAALPIVITSNKAVGQRKPADWGGVVICGKAKNNQSATGTQLEGFGNITFENTLGFHGGAEDEDNSGFMRYVRLEFPGLAFEPNREINGLTLGSVGRATEIKYVQVSFCFDDAFEWFGGTVNGSNLISWKTTDDDFDTDFGYSGINQFGIAVRDSLFYDLTYNATSGSSTSEGFESNNDAGGTEVLPLTSAIFSNFTMVGPIPVGQTYAQQTTDPSKAAFRRGARIRANSSQRIVNSIFMGYRNFVSIEGVGSVRNTNFPAALAVLAAPNNTAVDVKTKQIAFANNLIVNTAAAIAPSATANGLVEVATANQLTPITDWLKQTGPLANKIDPVAFTAGTVLVSPLASSTTPNFRPVTGSPALSGANFKDNVLLATLFTDTKEIQTARVAPVFPNPVSNGFLNFGVRVEAFGIFDNAGKLVKSGLNTDRVSIQDLSTGLYFIKLDGKMQKFVVQK